MPNLESRPGTPPMVLNKAGLFVQQAPAQRLMGYPVIQPDLHQCQTPARLARNPSYKFELHRGLPSIENLQQLVSLLFPSGWPLHAEQGENDYFHPVHSKRYFLDRQGLPIIKFRVVLTTEGELFMALNGDGSRKIPFHHQMAVHMAMVVDGLVNYDLHLRRSPQAVLFAGELFMGSDGLVYGLSNRSGHYKPPLEAFNVMLDWLSLRQDRLADVLIRESYSANNPEPIQESEIKMLLTLRASKMTGMQTVLLSGNKDVTNNNHPWVQVKSVNVRSYTYQPSM
jgi:hypothetical protein